MSISLFCSPLPALRASVTPEEQPFVDSMIGAFQPVTARSDGVYSEGAAVDPNARYRVEAITVPRFERR